MVINRKNIWSLSWPLIIANFTIPLVGLTDTVIMGHMPNSIYLAAIAIGGIVFNFIYADIDHHIYKTLDLERYQINAYYRYVSNVQHVFIINAYEDNNKFDLNFNDKTSIALSYVLKSM